MAVSVLQMIFASKPGGSPQHFGRMYDKKVNLLGLFSLMALPQESTPPQLQNAWPQLMAGTMRLLTTLKDQQVCLTLVSHPKYIVINRTHKPDTLNIYLHYI